MMKARKTRDEREIPSEAGGISILDNDGFFPRTPTSIDGFCGT